MFIRSAEVHFEPRNYQRATYHEQDHKSVTYLFTKNREAYHTAILWQEISKVTKFR